MKKMMMTMLNRLAFAYLICASLILVRAQALPRINRDEDARPRELISEGLGVGRIYVGHSTADDVTNIYGKTFETVEHGAQSDEMRYAPLGLSFYYCRADQQKRIFRIEVRAPFNGFVLTAYGQIDPTTGGASDQQSLRYPGVEFATTNKNSDAKSAPVSPGAKVTAIDVVTSRSGADCDASNFK
jgi:hypothetical protein